MADKNKSVTPEVPELSKEERASLVSQALELAGKLDLVLVTKSESLSELEVSIYTDAFQIQREYTNFADFLQDAKLASAKMFTRYQATGAVTLFERVIQKAQKIHPEFDRNEAIDWIRKTRSGQEQEEFATVGAEIITKLK